MDKLICIAGTPKFSSSDMLWTKLAIEAVQTNPEYKNGNYKGKINIPMAMQITLMVYTTPENIFTKIKVEDFESWYKKVGEGVLADWNDYIRQLQSVYVHDITKSAKGSLEEAAKTIAAKMLVVLNKQDHCVNHLISKQLTGLTKNTKYIELDASFGHSYEVIPIREILSLLAE